MFTAGEDDIVVNKDGGLIAVFELSGIDSDAATSSDVDYYLNALDGAYAVFSNTRAIFTWLVHRRRTTWYPDASFPDPYSARIDANRKREFANGKNYINRHYLAITMEPEGGLSGFSSRMSFYVDAGFNPIVAVGKSLASYVRSSENFPYSASELKGQIGRFEDQLARFTERLAGLGLARVSGDALRGFLRRSTNPSSTQDEVVRSGAFLDNHIPNAEILFGKDELVFDERFHVAGISLKEAPKLSSQGAFDRLLTVDGEMVMSQTFRMAVKKDAESHLRSVRQYNEMMKYGILTWVYVALSKTEGRANEHRLEAAEQAHHAMSELTMGDVNYGWHSIQVMAMGESVEEMERVAGEVSGMLDAAGMTPIREKTHLLSAFCGGIPGMWRLNKRWIFVEVPTLSDFTPFRTVYPGEMENNYLTEQRKKYSPALAVLNTEHKTPCYLNLHVNDLGHALVVGPSRSGKSSGMNVLISQFRKYYPCRVIIFDKDRSCRIPTIMQGGDHIDVSANKNIRWNPMSLLDDPSAMEFLVEWIEGLIGHRGYRVTSEDGKSIWSVVQSISEQEKRLWTLGHLHSILPSHLQTEMDAWVGNGILAHYFDNSEDTFSLSDFCCIEMGEILQREAVARAFMDYAFFRVYKMLRESRSENGVIPTLIYIEECWFMLANPYFEQKIRDWTKTFAKLSAQLVMATQSLEDIANSNVFSSLRDNILTRIYLPNPNAMSEMLMPLYQGQFGLHEDQISQIALGTQKRDYFIQQPGTFRRALMSIDPESLAIVRSDALAQNVFDKWMRSDDPNWKDNYIKEITGAH